MADEPDNATLRLLRDIGAAQEGRSELLNEHANELHLLRKEIRDRQETTATALGLGVHSNLRREAIEKQVEDLTKRVERLEKQH